MKLQPFSERFRAWRLSRGLTQVQAGALIGRHGNTVARWERGEITPDPIVQTHALHCLRGVGAGTGERL